MCWTAAHTSAKSLGQFYFHNNKQNKLKIKPLRPIFNHLNILWFVSPNGIANRHLANMRTNAIAVFNMETQINNTSIYYKCYYFILNNNNHYGHSSSGETTPERHNV